MAMNFGDFYCTHNDTMKDFLNKFNELDDDNVLMIENRKETFTNDGSFLFSDLGVAVGYDWEFRKTGYPTHGQFLYKRFGVGQYGTKLAKPSIKISLQISYDGTGLLVAWHEDFDKLTNVNLTSQTKVNRNEPMSCTLHYKEYNISTPDGIRQFKDMIKRAVSKSTFNHSVFS